MDNLEPLSDSLEATAPTVTAKRKDAVEHGITVESQDNTSKDLSTTIASGNGEVKIDSTPVTSEIPIASQPSSLVTTKQSKNAPPSLQETLQSLTDQALQFLSTASNETIGACLVGLSATTYLILGRVGLVLMGVVGGVVLHATWEGSHDTSVADAKRDEERRRREIGLDVVRRALAWRDGIGNAKGGNNSTVDEDQTKVELFGTKQNLDFNSLPPESALALTQLVDAGVRDYVKWWYSPLIPDEPVFPSSTQQIGTAFLLSISNHLGRKRPADAFLDFLTHSSSILIVFLNELATAVNSAPHVSTQEAIQIYLQSKPDSNLSYVINTEHQQKKLDLVADDILQTYLEHKSYNCEPVRFFLREVLSKIILDMTVQNCSRAEFINDWIVYLLDDDYVPLSAPDGGDNSEETMDKGKAAIPPALDDDVVDDSPEQIRHRRVVSKAHDAMDEAMREAARLTQMIAEDDARRIKEREQVQVQRTEAAAASDVAAAVSVEPIASSSKTESVKDSLAASITFTDDASEITHQGIHTPTSSQSDNLQTSPPLSQSENESVPRQSESSGTWAEIQPKEAATSFDQIIPQDRPTALLDEEEQTRRELPPMTLHNATVVIMDDSDPADRSAIRNKPITEFLVQLEPAASVYTGWMIVRRLHDFEKLHQILFRIARVSDAKKFAEAHLNLPSWKGTTKPKYREELERYLNDAMQHRSLADSEGMKRFLEKDQYMSPVPNKQAFPGLGAIENVGKGVIDSLGQAPKGIVGGSKAIVGGVNSVFGAAGRSITKKGNSASVSSRPAANRSSSSISSMSQIKGELTTPATTLGTSSAGVARLSQEENVRSLSPIVDTQPALVEQMERRPSNKPEATPPPPGRQELEYSALPILGGDQFITLPPPPAVMPDDYDVKATPTSKVRLADAERTASSSRASEDVSARVSVDASRKGSATPESPLATNKPALPPRPSTNLKPANAASGPPPLSEQEAQVAVELGLAAITELYKLSSAWSVRLAFLSAAKSILLRPGNAQLDSLRQLMQTAVLDTHFSDSGIAHMIKTTRANSLPTEEELKAWPPERTAEERETLRRRARGVLLEKGMPQALNSVMGQAASAEALGRVFDALQVPKIARGLVFGLALQGLRAVVQ